MSKAIIDRTRSEQFLCYIRTNESLFIAFIYSYVRLHGLEVSREA